MTNFPNSKLKTQKSKPQPKTLKLFKLMSDKEIQESEGFKVLRCGFEI